MPTWRDRLRRRHGPRCHDAAVQTDTYGSTGRLFVAGLAGLAHLVVGYFYLAGGLVIPGPALVPLWLFWLALRRVAGAAGCPGIVVDGAGAGGRGGGLRARPGGWGAGVRLAGVSSAGEGNVVAVEQDGGDPVVGQQRGGDHVGTGSGELVVEVPGRQQVGRRRRPARRRARRAAATASGTVGEAAEP